MQAAGSEQFRVLIIDDNPAIHQDFRRILSMDETPDHLAAVESALFPDTPRPEVVSGRDVQLFSAFQGEEGYLQVKDAQQSNAPFAVAFVDMRMPPGWDGIETIEHLWKVDPDIQVVICTAYSDYSWEEIRKRTGDTNNLLILKKPFDNAEVLQLVHALTHKWVATRESRTTRQELEQLVKRRTAELQQQNNFLKITSEIASVGYWRIGATDDASVWSDSMFEIFGRSPAAGPPTLDEFISLHDPLDRGVVWSEIEEASTGGMREYDAQIRTPAGRVVHLHTRLIRASEADGDRHALVGATLDVTPYEAAVQQATEAALHDPLTKLANRTRFGDALVSSVAQAKSTGVPAALLLFDLDDFKEINDQYGHQAGDALLIAFANRLVGCFRKSATVARLGGDEFAVIVPVTERAAVEQLVADIDEQLREPIDIDGVLIQIKASIGVALSPADGATADEVHRNADMALYSAKKTCERHCCFFHEQLALDQNREAEMRRNLRTAIAGNQFAAHFQPIFSTETGRIVVMESLLRWQHPQFGLSMPDEFIQVAETSGDIVALDHWMLNEALMAATTWPEEVRVAVNVSAAHFLRREFFDTVMGYIHFTGIDAHRVEIEVTETALLSNTAHTSTTLRKLKDQGVRIVMDDFGVGYSALSYLSVFPFNCIKLDRSFVASQDDPIENRAVMMAISTLGASLDIETTIEGIETTSQLEFAMELGFNFLQGYLLSMPVPLSAIDEAFFDKQIPTLMQKSDGLACTV
ncbi:MAG: EAL domain-containing protein [Planctomycetaceae bacterium]